ncbi:MAG: UpxY family transcription antiterminator [Bacteroidetes bacterium]|nr:UpxY family transcription antiterminator [Bacteroidota bacterium]
MQEEKSPWKVIYTASRQEKKVVALLQKMNIPCYLPLIKQLRFWSDRKKWVEAPLFHGYVFVKPEPKDRDTVTSLPGVVKFIRHNGSDALVPEKDIALIQNLILKGYNIEESGNLSDFKKGDTVQILQGPLKGITAEVLQSGTEKFILLSFDTISQTVKVFLPQAILKKIEKTV